MKKYIFLLICLFLGVFCFAAAAEGEPTVYVSSAHGNDESAGTADAPLKTLYAGFRALPNGGKIVVTDTVLLLEATNEFPKVDGLITITSVGDKDYRTTGGGNASIRLLGHVALKSSVKFENLRIITMDKNLVFLCNGYYTCFGEGLEVSALSSSATLPSIVGGTVGTLYQGTGTVQGKTTVYRAEDAKMTVLALPTENMDAAAVQAAKAANEAAMQAAFAEEFVIRSTIPFAERNVTASGEASKQTASVSACGDLNGDGRVTVTDVKALLGAALRASVTNIFARDPSFRCACIRHCLIQ